MATATTPPRPTTAAGSRRPTCPRPSARQPSARSTSSSAPPTSRPRAGWIRTWLDTVLELPWGTRTTDTADVAAARAVLDADHTGLDDVKDRIVEYLAVRGRRAERGMEVVGGRGVGRHARPRRPARRRQDVARRVRRAGARPQLRPRRPRRRPRRGRDPRPPPHLRRCAARPHRPGDQGGRLDEPGRPARRGRQGRLRLPRRPRGRPARGARPRPEPHLPRPLPRGRPRPVGRASSSRPPTSPRRSPGRCSTAWRSSGSTATPRTRRSRSPATTCSPRQLERAGLTADEVVLDRRGAGRGRRASYTREAGVRQLERALAKTAPQGRRAARGGHRDGTGHGRRRRASRDLPRPGALHARGRRPDRRARRRHRPRGDRRGRRRALRRGRHDER